MTSATGGRSGSAEIRFAVEVVSALHRVEARRFYERLGFEVTANYFVRSP